MTCVSCHSRVGLFLACLIFVTAVAGCAVLKRVRSPTSAEQPAPPTEPVLPALSETAQKRAEALARYSLGVKYEEQRDIAAALSNYMIAAELDPDNEPLKLRIAVLLVQQKRLDEAIQILEQLAAAPTPSDRTRLMLALTYESAGRFKDAQRIYEKLLTEYPERHELYANLARLHLKQEKINEATRVLEEAIEKVQNPNDLLVLLTAMYLHEARTSEDPTRYYTLAATALEKLLRQRPDDVWLREQVAQVWLSAEQVEKAVQLLESVEDALGAPLDVVLRHVRLFATSPNATNILQTLENMAQTSAAPQRLYFYVGGIAEALGDSSKALAYYRKATEGTNAQLYGFVSLALLHGTNLSEAASVVQQGLELYPEHPILLQVLANIRLLEESYEDAVSVFARAAKAAETTTNIQLNAAFYHSYALALQRVGRLDEAAEKLTAAIQSQPLILESYLQTVFRMKDEEAQKNAIAVLEKVGELMPGDPEVYIYLGVLNLYLKHYSEALLAFEKVEQMVATQGGKEALLNAQFYFWYGSAAERVGKIELAEEKFLKCIDLDPNHAEALNYIAYMWAERGVQLDRALEFVQRALRLQPSSGAFIDTLGWIYFMQGNYTQALVEINRAAELIPEDPTILEHLGDVFEKLGDEQQAMPHWKRSFILDPTNEKVAEKLRQRGVDLDELKKQASELQSSGASAQPASEGQGSVLSNMLSEPDLTTLEESLDTNEEEQPGEPDLEELITP